MSYQSNDASLEKIFLEKDLKLKNFNKEEDIREIRSRCVKFIDKTFPSDNYSISRELSFFKTLVADQAISPLSPV